MSLQSGYFFIFLAVALAGYYLLAGRSGAAAPEKGRFAAVRQSIFLLAASLFFYACAGAAYLPLLLAAAALAYGAALLLARVERPRVRKGVLAAALALLLANLCFFKYCGPLVARLALPQGAPAMPLGVSFYTFALSGYLIDQYRRGYPPEKNFVRFALFASFFPVISSGPIERGDGLLPQLAAPHAFDYETFCQGASRVLWGFFKKFVVADTLAVAVDRVFAGPAAYPGPYLCLAVLLYAYQIYCDFSGYSDIAIGLARLFGFSVRENFRRPYAARTLAEFWSRWHISLSSWLQDYVFEPLAWSGWTKKLPVVGRYFKKPPTYSALVITFLVSGLWHGVGWTYVVWGLVHGVLQVLGKMTKKQRRRIVKRLKLRTDTAAYRLFQQLLVLAMVCVSYVFFRAPTMGTALYFLKNAFSGWGALLSPGAVIATLKAMGIGRVMGLLLLGGVGLTEWVEWRAEHGGLRSDEWMRALDGKKRMALYYALALLVMTFGALGRSSFIYFAF